MIDLTPIDVRKKKGDFKRAVRGYDTDLVDDFLDLVAERLEELVKQNMSLTDRLARLEEQVGEYRQRDKALTEALVTAQEVREEVRRQAEKEAELVRREAEADAQRVRAEIAASFEREEDNLRRLRARRLQMIQSFRNFLERELSELAVSQEALEMEQTDSAKGGEKKQPVKRAASRPRPESAPAADVASSPSTAARAAAPTSEPLPRMDADAQSSKDDDEPDWLSTIMEEKRP